MIVETRLAALVPPVLCQEPCLSCEALEVKVIRQMRQPRCMLRGYGVRPGNSTTKTGMEPPPVQRPDCEAALATPSLAVAVRLDDPELFGLRAQRARALAIACDHDAEFELYGR